SSVPRLVEEPGVLLEPGSCAVTWSIDTRPFGGAMGGTKLSAPEFTRVSSAVDEGVYPIRRRGRVSRRKVAENIRSGTLLARTVASIVVGLASKRACSGAVRLTRLAGCATLKRVV